MTTAVDILRDSFERVADDLPAAVAHARTHVRRETRTA